jgi:uncharacterized protein
LQGFKKGDLKRLEAYKIPLKGLSVGQHSFSFIVDREFFECFDDEEISDSHVEVSITMQKSTYTYELTFLVQGTVSLPCDRCLDELEMNIKNESNLFIKHGETFQEVDDEVVLVPEDEGYFDVSPYIFEYIKLSLPIQRVHKKGKCNSEMEERIQSLKPHDSESKTDPRWDSLRNLTTNN